MRGRYQAFGRSWNLGRLENDIAADTAFFYYWSTGFNFSSYYENKKPQGLYTIWPIYSHRGIHRNYSWKFFNTLVFEVFNLEDGSKQACFLKM